jgi:two-component system chemotaxis response regulator CheY
MKFLILEDDFFQSKLMGSLFRDVGSCDLVAKGQDAVELFKKSIVNMEPYDVVFLDIMVPGMDGQKVLLEMRKLQEEHGIKREEHSKIIMVSALGDKDNVATAYKNCDAYLVKPYEEKKLHEMIVKLGFFRT